MRPDLFAKVCCQNRQQVPRLVSQQVSRQARMSERDASIQNLCI